MKKTKEFLGENRFFLAVMAVLLFLNIRFDFYYIKTCGDYSGTTKARYVEVLEFRHFVTMFEFSGDGHFRGEKHLIQKINCSVVLDLGCGNTKEDLYTIEDRPKGGS